MHVAQTSPVPTKTAPQGYPRSPDLNDESRPRGAGFGAGNEIRTHDFNLGKVALYR